MMLWHALMLLHLNTYLDQVVSHNENESDIIKNSGNVLSIIDRTYVMHEFYLFTISLRFNDLGTTPS